MKRPRFFAPQRPARKVACTVSAAALMLGVSQAATVGLHFQVHYCYDSRYTGFPVTMTAFGIGPAGWQNLSQMDTGYACSSGSGPYTLANTINTTTSTGGLNPLPNGSITVTWSADTANFSGFAGYAGPPPGYDYGGTPPNPFPTGEWQVYSAFLRDSVNFGPNNQLQGYSVDITGLKTLFTNSPFAVELIAASDSMQTLTNAFVIDATGSTTQSVVYPSTPFPSHDWGGTGGWFRGHGGGLSTASGSFDTDHLKIMGNHAQNGVGGGYPGFDRASTISGFIITDKPVISMSPQAVLVSGGDTVVWSGYAVGVPPLAYQWRRDGVAIPGATTSTYGVTNASLASIGTYDLQVTNLYGTAVSAPVTIGDTISATRINNLVLDSNPNGPEHNGLNTGAPWLASSTDGASVTRTGVMSFSTNVPSKITVAGETNFDSATGTIMFWMRSSGLADPLGNPAAIFDRLKTTGCSVAQYNDGTVAFEADIGAGPVGAVFTTNSVVDNHWHHIAASFYQSASAPGANLTLYVDGQFNSVNFLGGDWSWATGQPIELGLSHNTNVFQAYSGLLDDVRYYNRVLTPAEVASAATGAVVDASSLVMQLNFTTAPSAGLFLQWKATDVILQSAGSVTGPYTDVPGAASPYSGSVQGAAKYYRYRGHTPQLLIANPFLM